VNAGRTVCLALVVSVLAAGGGGISAAAEPKRPEAHGSLSSSLTGDAKRAYEEARVLFKDGDYKRSLEALERAGQLAPDPRLFWNMAACEKKLRHYARAIRDVERYLVGASGLIGEDERREAEQFLAASKAYVGTVTLVSNVDGTEIVIDDELVGTTPLPKPILVDEGEHRARFARSSYRSIERVERVPAGATLHWVVDLELERRDAQRSEGRSSSTTRPPLRIGPLLLAGGGVVLGAIGTGLVIKTVGDASDAERDCGTRCPPSRWEGSRTQQRVGDVMIGVGVAALAGAVVWWLLQPSGSPERVAGVARWP
jgi:hypothetical protein